MKCAKCGAEATAESVFCPKCGDRLAASQASPGIPASPEPSPSQGRMFGGRRPIADIPEEVLWQGGYSPKAMAAPAVLAAVVSVGLLIAGFAFSGPFFLVALGLIAVIWIVLLGRLLERRIGVHYKLTNQRFFHQSGVLRRVTNRIEVIDIDDIKWEQSIPDRLVGVGSITILSADMSDKELILDGIEDVERVAGLMDGARRAERLRRGVSVESI